MVASAMREGSAAIEQLNSPVRRWCPGVQPTAVSGREPTECAPRPSICDPRDNAAGLDESRGSEHHDAAATNWLSITLPEPDSVVKTWAAGLSRRGHVSGLPATLNHRACRTWERGCQPTDGRRAPKPIGPQWVTLPQSSPTMHRSDLHHRRNVASADGDRRAIITKAKVKDRD